MDLTLLSYNIHKGFNFLNRKFVLKDIRALIKDSGADLVCLQEILGAHSKHGKHLPEHYEESQFEYLADKIWEHYSYGRNAVYQEGHHGNCILSRFPVLNPINTDLSLTRFEQRGMLSAQIQLPEGSHRLFLQTTHLNLLHRHRVRQLRLMKEHFAQIPVEAPVLLAGDFNDWRSSLETEETLSLHNAGTVLTFPSWYALVPLDRVYYRNVELLEFKVMSSEVLAKYSDHLPVIAKVRIGG